MSACDDFLATVNAVLDGDAPASALRADHVRSCRNCREVAAAARLLASAGPALRSPPPVPAGLTPKLVRAMRRRRLAPVLVAGLLIAGGVWLLAPVVPSGSANGAKPSPGRGWALHPSTPSPPPRVADQWAAVTAVARTASEKASGPARLVPDSFHLPSAPPGVGEWNESVRLAPLTQAAEPLTGTARRAVGLFLRDLGLSAKPAG